MARRRVNIKNDKNHQPEYDITILPPQAYNHHPGSYAIIPIQRGSPPPGAHAPAEKKKKSHK